MKIIKRNKDNKEWEDRFVEEGANLEHDRWARWQKYMFSKFVEDSDGKGKFVCLPVEFYKRWTRQIATPYSELPEEEKESDRKETRNYLPLVSKIISQARKEGMEEVAEGIRKSKVWKLVLNTPRMIMIKDKELDKLLTQLTKDNE